MSSPAKEESYIRNMSLLCSQADMNTALRERQAYHYYSVQFYVFGPNDSYVFISLYALYYSFATRFYCIH